MNRRIGALIACIGLVFLVARGSSAPFPQDKLPAPVANTFKTMFPNGEIQQLDAEEEDGVMVYDFEFKAGDRQKEADIAGDGTMMESTLVITAKDIPPAAMKSIQKVANGAKLGRMEWLETFYKTKEGKLVKLSKSEIHYATEMWRGEKMGEVFVTPTGKVTEKPEWKTVPKPPASGAVGTTGK